MKIIDSNPGALEKLAASLTAMSGVQGKVGWFESAVYEDGTPVAYVASVQEFGHGAIPPRLGMRQTAEEKQNEWAAVAEHAAKQVIDNKISPEDGMELVVQKAEGDISKHIASVTSPPLSPLTILARAARKKGQQVTGKTIGVLADKLKTQKYDKTIRDMAGVSTKPLIDTHLLFDTLTSVVERK